MQNENPNQQQNQENKKSPKIYAHLLSNHSSNQSTFQKIINQAAAYRKTTLTLATGLFLGFGLAVSQLGFAEDDPNIQQVFSDANINKEIGQNLASCQKGEAGSVGRSMIDALKIHQEFAAITPPVEQLFDNGCFSNLNKILDLSVAIPSVSGLLSAIGDAVNKAVEKKVCNAINNVTGNLIAPLNQGIAKINEYSNLNMLANREISQQLGGVDQAFAQYFKTPEPAMQENINLNSLDNLNNTLRSYSQSPDLQGTHNSGINSLNSTAQATSAEKSMKDMQQVDARVAEYNRVAVSNQKPQMSNQQVLQQKLAVSQQNFAQINQQSEMIGTGANPTLQNLNPNQNTNQNQPAGFSSNYR